MSEKTIIWPFFTLYTGIYLIYCYVRSEHIHNLTQLMHHLDEVIKKYYIYAINCLIQCISACHSYELLYHKLSQDSNLTCVGRLFPPLLRSYFLFSLLIIMAILYFLTVNIPPLFYPPHSKSAGRPVLQKILCLFFLQRGLI